MPTDEVAAAAIGSPLDETVDVTADEIAWAVRKTVEHAASEQPLVVVFDDIHHGEQTFLDLIEHVALLTSDAPILLVCMARPELGERRPGWPVALQLAPLGDDEVEQLIPERITGALRREIVRTAGGNPLFVVEMLAIADETSGEAVVPPTLRALLGARLDRLDSGERDVLQRGAVGGEIFHGGAALALSTGDPSPARHLTALVRKNLIRPEASQLSGEDAFRFCHLLMRDTAYDALPKATRAELHERLAGWLEERGAGLVDLDQILGYHLEQAVLYREELGLPDDTGLRTAARRRLTAAGRRAYRTQDYGATIRLLERAAALLPADEFDLGIELELFRARFWTSKDEAFRQACVFAEDASGAGNRVGELCGRIQQSLARSWLEPRGELGRLAGLVEQALPVFEAADDDVALCLGHNAFAFVLRTRAQLDRAVDEYERAAEFAARAGLDDRFVHERSLCRFNGTTPASELLAWQDGLNERDRRGWEVRQNRAVATGMLGRIDEALAQLSELQAELAEQRATMVGAVIIGEAGVDIEFLAGDYAAAATLAEESCTLSEELGEEASLWGYAAYLALAYCDLGRLEEADAWASRAAAADRRAYRRAGAAGERPRRPRRGALPRRPDAGSRRGVRAGAGPLRAQGQSRHGRSHAGAPRRDRDTASRGSSRNGRRSLAGQQWGRRDGRWREAAPCRTRPPSSHG